MLEKAITFLENKMAFLLNNQPISSDVEFTTPDGTRYPANWIRLASPAERAAIGITKE